MFKNCEPKDLVYHHCNVSYYGRWLTLYVTGFLIVRMFPKMFTEGKMGRQCEWKICMLQSSHIRGIKYRSQPLSFPNHIPLICESQHSDMYSWVKNIYDED
jgi:hypothetical protein